MMNVVPIPDRRPAGLPESTSLHDFAQAVKESLCGASNERLGELLGVPANNVPFFRSGKEWLAIKNKLWPEIKEQLHSELAAARHLATRSLLERVRDGDPHYDLEGTLVGYRPLRAKDLSDIVSKTSDTIAKLEGEIGSIRGEDGQVSSKELLEALTKFARAKDITPGAA